MHSEEKSEQTQVWEPHTHGLTRRCGVTIGGGQCTTSRGYMMLTCNFSRAVNHAKRPIHETCVFIYPQPRGAHADENLCVPTDPAWEGASYRYRVRNERLDLWRALEPYRILATGEQGALSMSDALEMIDDWHLLRANGDVNVDPDPARQAYDESRKRRPRRARPELPTARTRSLRPRRACPDTAAVVAPTAATGQPPRPGAGPYVLRHVLPPRAAGAQGAGVPTTITTLAALGRAGTQPAMQGAAAALGRAGTQPAMEGAAGGSLLSLDFTLSGISNMNTLDLNTLGTYRTQGGTLLDAAPTFQLLDTQRHPPPPLGDLGGVGGMAEGGAQPAVVTVPREGVVRALALDVENQQHQNNINNDEVSGLGDHPQDIRYGNRARMWFGSPPPATDGGVYYYQQPETRSADYPDRGIRLQKDGEHSGGKLMQFCMGEHVFYYVEQQPWAPRLMFQMIDVDSAKTDIIEQCSKCNYKFRTRAQLDAHREYTREQTGSDMCHIAERRNLWERPTHGSPSFHFLLPGLMECLKITFERQSIPWGKPMSADNRAPLRFPLMDPLSIPVLPGGARVIKTFHTGVMKKFTNMVHPAHKRELKDRLDLPTLMYGFSAASAGARGNWAQTIAGIPTHSAHRNDLYYAQWLKSYETWPQTLKEMASHTFGSQS